MIAALLTKLNAPLELCEIDLTGPLEYGQVLVKIIVSGICGAQLQEISGQKLGGPLPHPLGHEGCGRVLEIGPGVKHVKVGNKVVCHWRRGAGIESDFPKYMTHTLVPDLKEGVAWQEITGGRVTTFMEQSICSENRLTAVPEETPDELCALLGCGLSTALATLENEARLLRGESILIVGCGGLGTNLILAAKLAGAWPIVVADVMPKEALARELGAVQFWNFNHAIPPAGHRSFDVIVDTTGNRYAIRETILLLAPSGRYIMVGQPKRDETLDLQNAFHFFEGAGKTLKATQGGGYRPEQDCPRFARAFNAYEIDTKQLVSDRFALKDINKALDVVRAGNASRVMIYP
jgi:Zn-dependent alcohol dehydrogenase